MSRITPLALLPVVFLFLLLGCRKQPQEIHGQAYVTTKAAMNIKLGSLSVSLVEPSVLSQLAAQPYHSIENYISGSEEVQPTLDGLLEQIQKSTAASKKFESEVKDMEEMISSLQSKWKLQSNEYLRKNSEALRLDGAKIGDLVLIKHSCESNQVYFLEKAHTLTTEHKLLSELVEEKKTKGMRIIEKSINGIFSPSASISTTCTDADGNFRFEVPPGKKYFLVAHHERNVGDDVEYYFWIVPIYANRNPKNLIYLNNLNMLDLGPDVSLTRRKAALLPFL